MPATLRLASLLVSLLMLAACTAKTNVTTPQGETGNAPAHTRVYQVDGASFGEFTSVRSTPDGGYVALGNSEDSNPRAQVLLVLKTRADGSVQWRRRLSALPGSFEGGGGSANILLMPDGGYLVSGTLFHVASVIRLDAQGEIVWQWNYGEESTASSVQLTSAGQILVAGIDAFEIGDAASRVWVVRLNADGTEPRLPYMEWRMTESRAENFLGDAKLISLEDGGFLIAGTFESDFQRAGVSWAARVDGLGNTLWSNSYSWGGSFQSAQRIAGGFALAGFDNGVVQIMELSEAGAVNRQLRYTPPSGDAIASRYGGHSNLLVTTDSYVIASSYSVALGPYEEANTWILKVSRSDGAIQWQYRYGAADLVTRPYGLGTVTSWPRDIDIGNDGSFRIAGGFNLEHVIQGNLSVRQIGTEPWILEIAADGRVETNERSFLSSVPTAASAGTAPLPIPAAFGVFSTLLARSPAVTPPEVVSEDKQFRIETQTGETGVLPPPSMGTNSAGNSFYWGHVPEAAGYILYYSLDGRNYVRNSTWYSNGGDFSGAPGFYRMVAFDAEGYSEYSGVMEIEDDTSEDGPYTLQFSVTGRGVVSVGTTIECEEDSLSGTCAAIFLGGAVVPVTATAIDDQVFEGWGGDCAQFNAQRNIDVFMDGDINCEARFSTPSDTVTLTVVVENDPTAQVVSEPAGIVCSMAPTSDCTQQLSPGSRLLLTATPFPPTLTWEGCDRVPDVRFCEVTVNSSRTVRARY